MAAPAADQAPLGVDLLSNELAPSACHEFLGVEFCSQQGAHPERQVTIVATLSTYRFAST